MELLQDLVRVIKICVNKNRIESKQNVKNKKASDRSL